MPSEGAGEYTTARFEPFFSPEPDLESEPGLAPQEPITPDATPPPSNGCLFAWQDKEEEQDYLFDKEKPERDRVEFGRQPLWQGLKVVKAYAMRLFGGRVDWKANKQATVTTSTTEAELLSLSQAAKEGIFPS